MEEREVVLFIDLHAHSRKKNAFIYGNEENKAFVYPKLLSKLSPYFNFDDCVFKVQKQREKCARVSIYRCFGLVNTFTLETSFCGANYGRFGGFHFNTTMYEDLGQLMCEAVLDLFDPDQTKVREALKELAGLGASPCLGKDGDSDADDSEDGGNDGKRVNKILRTSRKTNKSVKAPIVIRRKPSLT
jgi:hypothetical protein